jgi:hypothetical protein
LNCNSIKPIFEKCKEIARHFGRVNKGSARQLVDESEKPFLLPTYSEIRRISFGKTLEAISSNVELINTKISREISLKTAQNPRLATNRSKKDEVLMNLQKMKICEEKATKTQSLMSVVTLLENFHKEAEKPNFLLPSFLPMLNRLLKGLDVRVNLFPDYTCDDIKEGVMSFKQNLLERFHKTTTNSSWPVFAAMFHPRDNNLKFLVNINVYSTNPDLRQQQIFKFKAFLSEIRKSFYDMLMPESKISPTIGKLSF